MDKATREILAKPGDPRWLHPAQSSRRYVHFLNWWTRLNDGSIAGRPTLAIAENGRETIEVAIERLITICDEFRPMPIALRVDQRDTVD